MIFFLCLPPKFDLYKSRVNIDQKHHSLLSLLCVLKTRKSKRTKMFKVRQLLIFDFYSENNCLYQLIQINFNFFSGNRYLLIGGYCLSWIIARPTRLWSSSIRCSCTSQLRFLILSTWWTHWWCETTTRISPRWCRSRKVIEIIQFISTNFHFNLL